jgi:hypothetical protein
VAFPDELLEQADHLARRDRGRPKQASLRRAVSTAYYALFHLLVSEAVGYWKLKGQRTALARAYDHGKMKHASHGCNSGNADLQKVAAAFLELQQVRHLADYDGGKTWTRVESVSHIDLAKAAFSSWGRVRDQRAAQDYLLSMLVSRK